ncbi:MAG: peptidyl-prolyl cis-trans isomerase [Proteobacteria bacterium]|nr:peptidyl-prolyl cis-trans isomerase [Pseudomonadota bacterium]
MFAAYRWLHPESANDDRSNRIVITDDDLRQMSVEWLAQGRPPPTPEQWRSLVDTKVREEVLYREALTLGLDRDDSIVKRRMAQKMEFLAEDVSSLAEPKPGELKAWYAANASRFALPPRGSFRHIYFSPDKRGAKARGDAERALESLHGEPASSDRVARVGDPYMFQDYYADRAADQIAAQFGPGFAQALFKLKPGEWTGPIESGYGWHLVYIDSLTPGRIPSFEEIEPDVKLGWMSAKREEVRARMYADMRAKYEVVLPAMDAAAAKAPAGGTQPR